MFEDAELVGATWSGDVLRLSVDRPHPEGADPSSSGAPQSLILRRRQGGAVWSVPFDGGTVSLRPLQAAAGEALEGGLWDCTVGSGAGANASEKVLRAGECDLRPAVVGNRAVDVRSNETAGVTLDVDQTARPVLDAVVGGVSSAAVRGSVLSLRLPVHVTGRGPRIEVHLVPEQAHKERHVLRAFLAPQPRRPGSAVVEVELPALGSARSWTVELRIDRLGAGPTTATDVVLLRRDRVTQLARSAAHRVRPDIARRSDIAVRRTGTAEAFRAATWQRRLRTKLGR